VYVFENNIPRCAPMSLLYVLFITNQYQKKILQMFYVRIVIKRVWVRFPNSYWKISQADLIIQQKQCSDWGNPYISSFLSYTIYVCLCSPGTVYCRQNYISSDPMLTMYVFAWYIQCIVDLVLPICFDSAQVLYIYRV
jgi:hypothetical protein